MALPILSDITFKPPAETEIDAQIGLRWNSDTYLLYSGASTGDITIHADDNIFIKSAGDGVGTSTTCATFGSDQVSFPVKVNCNGKFQFQASQHDNAFKSGNTHTVNFNGVNNQIVNANNATNTIAFSNLSADKIGKSGNIIINNPASVGSLAWAALPSTAYTPGGATISFDTNASSVSIMSYLVIASDKVLINYVGNFKSYGT